MYKNIDLDNLRAAIRVMDRQSPLYKVLKEELGLMGYWQNRPRGNPRKGYLKRMGDVSQG